MLPGIGSSELFVIALVALIVVGPKDLPVMLRKLGQWVAKMRGMANEFRASFDEMARQSELASYYPLLPEYDRENNWLQ